mgnify:CR=1 FL=1|jgi:hypothetical protein
MIGFDRSDSHRISYLNTTVEAELSLQGWRARPITVQKLLFEELATSTWSSSKSIQLPPKNCVRLNLDLAVPPVDTYQPR